MCCCWSTALVEPDQDTELLTTIKFRSAISNATSTDFRYVTNKTN